MSEVRDERAPTWSRIRRRTASKNDPTAPEAFYLASERDHREYATRPVERIAWPQGCDQCRRVIAPGAGRGARSFNVSRGQSPTTLYLCASCVSDLCRAGGIPEPEPGS